MSRGQVLAVDIGAGHVTAGVVSRKGEILFSQTMDTAAPERPGSLIARIEQLIESQLAQAKAGKVAVAGLGIGSPGIVNSALGVVVAAGNLPELFGARLGERYGRAFHLPVVVENDVNALALGEMLFGVAQGQKNFIVFALGTDLGGGIVQRGKLISGSNFIAAEFGHLTLDLHGQKCVCGEVGCAREWVSGAGLAERARELLPEDSKAIALAGARAQVTAREVFQAAEQGDPAAAELVDEFGRRFGALVLECDESAGPGSGGPGRRGVPEQAADHEPGRPLGPALLPSHPQAARVPPQPVFQGHRHPRPGRRFPGERPARLDHE